MRNLAKGSVPWALRCKPHSRSVAGGMLPDDSPSNRCKAYPATDEIVLFGAELRKGHCSGVFGDRAVKTTGVTRLVGVLITLVVVLNGGGALATTQKLPECEGIETYVLDVRTAQSAFLFPLAEFIETDVDEWEVDQLRTALESAKTMSIRVEGISAPAAATAMHVSLAGFFTTWTELLSALEQDGLLAAMPFLEQFEEYQSSIQQEGLAIELSCNVELIDHDGDGSPEIGPGVDPEEQIDADSGLTGSRENPVPLGQRSEAGTGVAITVVSVIPDATDVVLAENSFNSEPESGRQFFIAEVMVENLGTDTLSFDGNFRLRAQGSESIYRAFADRCGVVPNEWEEVDIEPGEQVTATMCWAVESNDTDDIVMFDLEADGIPRVYFSLVPDAGDDE
ncbi:hypothetical protein BH23CHL5_BH23CHL5_12990 [soil metagenome]